ncbi:MAG: hypothetical protein JNL82_00970 [Myxococcales bacterium]|nr:hypothetical protein [Myxococcales bacterium]
MVAWDQDLDAALLGQPMADVSRLEEARLLTEVLEVLPQTRMDESLRALQLDRRRVALGTLEWSKTTQGHWTAPGPNGDVYVIFNNTKGNEHRLVYGWYRYGAVDLGSGPPSELARQALQLAREGGPSGGPVPKDSAPHRWYHWHSAGDTLRRAGNAGELVIDVGRHPSHAPDDHALYCGYRDGSFAVLARGADRNLVALGDKVAEDNSLRELRPPVTARFGDLAVPWRFLDRGLYKGILSTSTGDFLFLDIGNRMYALIFAYGDAKYLPIAMRPLELIQVFDLAPILEALVGRQAFGDWLALTRATNPRSPGHFTSPPAPAERPAARSVRMLGEGTAGPALVHQLQATSASSGPRVSEAKSPEIDVEALVLEHLKIFHQRLPAGENGVATARAYLIGLVRKYLAGEASIEGTWRDVFAPIVESGDLDDMPSDKTARAALAIMKASPLVRRLDHQRWRICLDEARDPRSEVIHVLLREQLDRQS